MGPALQRPIRRFGLICGIVWLAAAPRFPTSIGWAQGQNQPAAPNDLAARINAEFEAVKERAAHVRLELPRLDQALETFATHLKDRADLSPADKAAALARIELARAVVRSHDATLRSATAHLNAAKDSTAAGPVIDALAQLLDVEGDKIVSVVRDEIARGSGDADQLAAAHAAYRKAVAELVEAARKAREAARATREQGQPAGESRGGKGDKQQMGR
jgi:hypothetical protein